MQTTPRHLEFLYHDVISLSEQPLLEFIYICPNPAFRVCHYKFPRLTIRVCEVRNIFQRSPILRLVHNHKRHLPLEVPYLARLLSPPQHLVVVRLFLAIKNNPVHGRLPRPVFIPHPKLLKIHLLKPHLCRPTSRLLAAHYLAPSHLRRIKKTIVLQNNGFRAFLISCAPKHILALLQHNHPSSLHPLILQFPFSAQNSFVGEQWHTLPILLRSFATPVSVPRSTQNESDSSPLSPISIVTFLTLSNVFRNFPKKISPTPPPPMKNGRPLERPSLAAPSVEPPLQPLFRSTEH